MKRNRIYAWQMLHIKAAKMIKEWDDCSLSGAEDRLSHALGYTDWDELRSTLPDLAECELLLKLAGENGRTIWKALKARQG